MISGHQLLLEIRFIKIRTVSVDWAVPQPPYYSSNLQKSRCWGVRWPFFCDCSGAIWHFFLSLQNEKDQPKFLFPGPDTSLISSPSCMSLSSWIWVSWNLGHRNQKENLLESFLLLLLPLPLLSFSIRAPIFEPAKASLNWTKSFFFHFFSLLYEDRDFHQVTYWVDWGSWIYYLWQLLFSFSLGLHLFKVNQKTEGLFNLTLNQIISGECWRLDCLHLLLCSHEAVKNCFFSKILITFYYQTMMNLQLEFSGILRKSTPYSFVLIAE